MLMDKGMVGLPFSGMYEKFCLAWFFWESIINFGHVDFFGKSMRNFNRAKFLDKI